LPLVGRSRRVSRPLLGFAMILAMAGALVALLYFLGHVVGGM
jgi:hypothetical protein